jgi:hypothetical protein
LTILLYIWRISYTDLDSVLGILDIYSSSSVLLNILRSGLGVYAATKGSITSLGL